MRIAIGVLIAIALFTGSGPLFFAIAVLMLVLFSARLWMGRVGEGLRVSRTFENRLFFNETARVTLTIANTSALPAPWVLLREYVPPALSLPAVKSQVVSLRGGETRTITYDLVGRRRGFHIVGPLTLSVGDVFGLAQRALYVPGRQYLIVYPRILTPHELELPTLALFGDVRSRRRILGDPSRVAGVRDYMAGDPLHDIHWPATAAAGSLQVKQYQPATTIQTMIFLDLHRQGYPSGDILYATDLAITVAATVANHMIVQRQEVGLATNGRLSLPPLDDLTADEARSLLQEIDTVPQSDAAPRQLAGGEIEVAIAPLTPAKGRTQLMRLLELLARVEIPTSGDPLLTLLVQQSLALPWGSTVVAVTGTIGDDLIMTLHRLREAGLLVVLFVIARHPDQSVIEQRLRAVGVRVRFVWREQEVEEL